MTATKNPRAQIAPPSKHQLAIMIWLCVFPTLTVINVAFGDWLRTLPPVLRTFVLATAAVPIVIYGFDALPSPHPPHCVRRLGGSRRDRNLADTTEASEEVSMIRRLWRYIVDRPLV